MINGIRSVRRAKGLTLENVAERCIPPTTAQTIGRLETGTRTLSLDWLSRIAAALDVEGSELLHLPQTPRIGIAALLDTDGAHAPTREEFALTNQSTSNMLAVRVTISVGDYRAGDEIWCRALNDDWAKAINRDVLVPRPVGRFIFGRLLNIQSKKLHILQPALRRQKIVNNPPWIAIAARLIRSL